MWIGNHDIFGRYCRTEGEHHIVVNEGSDAAVAMIEPEGPNDDNNTTSSQEFIQKEGEN